MFFRASTSDSELRRLRAWPFACYTFWVSMSILTDTTLLIRCPHCIVGLEGRPMIAYKDGRFVCRDCAHTERPGVPEYRCSCRPCLKVARGSDGLGLCSPVGTS